ncbi:hypothetical protein O1L68_15545 [Streptomyces lydicus]|nr:hypothetical protein [Streptomyces lydicus]
MAADRPADRPTDWLADRLADRLGGPGGLPGGRGRTGRAQLLAPAMVVWQAATFAGSPDTATIGV